MVDYLRRWGEEKYHPIVVWNINQLKAVIRKQWEYMILHKHKFNEVTKSLPKKLDLTLKRL